MTLCPARVENADQHPDHRDVAHCIAPQGHWGDHTDGKGTDWANAADQPVSARPLAERIAGKGKGDTAHRVSWTRGGQREHATILGPSAIYIADMLTAAGATDVYFRRGRPVIGADGITRP